MLLCLKESRGDCGEKNKSNKSNHGIKNMEKPTGDPKRHHVAHFFGDADDIGSCCCC